MTGYRVYCFPADSQIAEIIKTISDGNQDSVAISGLRPDKKYRIGITSLSSENESKLVSLEEQHKMRKSLKHIKFVFKAINTMDWQFKQSDLNDLAFFFAVFDCSWNSSLGAGSEPYSP